MLNTENPSIHHPDLDTYATSALVVALAQDQANAVQAVLAAAPAIAQAVAAAALRMQHGGRLIYVGAGTSGRLGVLDSVELYPTFSWPQDRALALMAGGNGAMFVAVEGAEDNYAQGESDMAALLPTAHDVALLIAASGATPYVMGALQAARASDALCIGIANNPHAPVATLSSIGITLDTGSELISGSTRLKAGTAQKIALNTFSSALMVRLNKVYGNLMVDLKATNAKLVRRTIALTMRAAHCDEATAVRVLSQCDHHVKTAVVAIGLGVDVDAARQRLDAVHGSVRLALAATAP